MSFLSRSGIPLLVAVSLALAGSLPAPAAEIYPPLCDLVIHQERLDLEEYRLLLDLARSDFAAYEEIFGLIEALWREDAIERMVYVEAKYDRDSARLALESADLVVERQQALIEQYRLACDGTSFRKAGERSRVMQRALQRYRKSHCDSLAKNAQSARLQLEFQRELLANVRDLRENNVATRPQLILAELEVRKEEQRLADATRREQACRATLAGPEVE